MGERAKAHKERAALYYPRVHFRSLEWLKGTLLAFGRIHRIVPTEHPLAMDPPEVRALSKRHGAPLPLVLEIDPEWPAIERAQSMLRGALLRADPAELVARYGEQATRAREAAVGLYELHRGKVNDALFSDLDRLGLVWDVEHSADDAYRPGAWQRVHPDLGEAILGVTAIASARGTGSDIVTDTSSIHMALAALDEQAILEGLVGHEAKVSGGVDVDRAADHLAHVVMTTRFDLSDVPIEEIADLARAGHDLRAFRSHLRAFAELVPEDMEPDALALRLEELADEVTGEWRRFERDLPARMKAAVRPAAASAVAELTKDVVREYAVLAATGGLVAVAAGMAAGAPALVATTAAAGVPIVFSVVRTVTAFMRRHEEDGPWRYLSRIEAAGGVELAVPRPYRREPSARP